MSRKAPCYQCKLREINCHSMCNEYKAWKIKDLERSRREKESRGYYRECVALKIEGIIEYNKLNRR